MKTKRGGIVLVKASEYEEFNTAQTLFGNQFLSLILPVVDEGQDYDQEEGSLERFWMAIGRTIHHELSQGSKLSDIDIITDDSGGEVDTLIRIKVRAFFEKPEEESMEDKRARQIQEALKAEMSDKGWQEIKY